MKRKVARIGPSTLMVSLPSKWVKHHHIEKGQELDVEDKDGKLIIHPADVSPLEKAEIHLHKKDQLLKRYLRSLYHRGFTEVKIICDEGLESDDIKRKLEAYVGFEMIEQGKKYCIIRNVAETIEKEGDAILRKIFLMNAMMAEESLAHLQKQDYEGLAEVATIEKTNDRLINLMYRILHKSGNGTEDNIPLHTTLLCLENIADRYRDLCHKAKERKIILSKELESLFKEMIQHYHNLMQVYYKPDQEKIMELKKKRDAIEERGTHLNEKIKREEFPLLHQLLSIAQIYKDIELTLGVEKI